MRGQKRRTAHNGGVRLVRMAKSDLWDQDLVRGFQIHSEYVFSINKVVPWNIWDILILRNYSVYLKCIFNWTPVFCLAVPTPTPPPALW